MSTEQQKPTPQTTTEESIVKPPRKKAGNGWIGVLGCSGCLGLIFIWIIAAFFLFGNYINTAIKESDTLFNENYNFNLNSDFNSNFNVNEFITEELNTNINEESAFYEPSVIKFGILENGKFIQPISLNKTEGYTFAVRFDPKSYNTGDDVSLSIYNDGEREDFINASFAEVKEGTSQTVEVAIPPNSSEFYIELFFYVNGELESSQTISMLSEE